MLSVDRYVGSFDSLLDRVGIALRHLGEALEEPVQLHCTPPIRVYRISALKTEAARELKARHTAWRSLVIAGTRAVALVEISKRDRTGSSERHIIVRGRETARAFKAGLQASNRYARNDGREYVLRFVSSREDFLTAFWLCGERSVFIPTRLGPIGRPRSKVYTERQFLRLLDHVRKRGRNSAPAKRRVR